MKEFSVEATFARALFVMLVALAAVVPASLLLLQLPDSAQIALPTYFNFYESFDFQVEHTEKLLALVVIFVGPAAALFLLPKAPAHSWKTLTVALVLFIPAYHEAQRQVSSHNEWLGLFWFAVVAGLLLTLWHLPARGIPGQELRHPKLDRSLLVDAAVVVAIALLYIPIGFEDAAISITFDPHVVSYILGPALTMRFGDGLVPGPDFHAHYGVGQAYLFSWFLGADIKETLEVLTRHEMAVSAAFYASAYLICVRYIGSRFWAALAIFTALFLSFQGEFVLRTPSNWPMRYPLLFVVAALFTETVTTRKLWPQFALGASLGLSVFWGTETGIYFCVATGLGLLAWRTPSAARTIAIVVSSAALSFAAVCLLAFGPGSISIKFVFGLLEPLLIYGGGFGSFLINWLPGYGYIYAVSGALLAAATVAMLTHLSRHGGLAGSKPAAFVAISGFIGLLMLIKFYSRSIDALWHLNALPLLVVAAWWLRRLHLRLTPYGTSGSIGLPAASALICAVFLLIVQDGRNPTYYGLRSYLQYRGVVNSLWRDFEPRQWYRPALPDPADIALIKQFAPPDGPIAILHLYDWTHLIDLQRVSTFYFLPSVYGYWFGPESLESTDILFVTADEETLEKSIADPDLAEIILPIIRTEFEPVARGKALVALRRTGSGGD